MRSTRAAFRYLIGKVKLPRVTLRDIGRRCSLSATAVSLALRNHPSIPEKTRARVRNAATAMRYRPDPALAALNEYRHQRNSQSPGYVLAYVTCFSQRNGWNRSAFFRRAFQGAHDRAEALGYRMEHCWLGEPGITPERFAQVLESRAIRGLVIAPLPQPASKLSLPWERFSCVAIGPSLVDPVLHSACGDQYQGIMLAIDRLRERGYRRIGLMLDPDADRRHNRKYQAAIAVSATAGSPLPLIASNPDDATVRAWLNTQKPDAVISDLDSVADRLKQLGYPAPERVGFASLVRSGRDDISGVDTFPEQIAATAVTLLRHMLHENELGIPSLPTCTMIPGVWVEGKTVRHL